MRTFKVDDNNDLVVENGNLVIVKDEEAVMLSCAQAVKAQYGEIIYNIEGSIPYNLLAWGGSPNLAQLEAYMRREILKVTGGLGISSFDMSVDKDVITDSTIINTTYGEVTLDELRISK